MTSDLGATLRKHFGFDGFKPGQEQVIRALIEGRSALAVFPTGGGKSLCYQLPALEVEGVTLVVSPLIALMKDQIDFLRSRGISAARLDSTLEASDAIAVTDGLRDQSLRLLYVAPERFNNERFVAEMKRTKIGLFAIDEAHCISEWGHNFRPDYLKLAETVKEIEAERVLALTATATPSVVEDICRSFGISAEDAVVTGFYRPNLTMFTTPTTREERDRLLISRLRERPAGPTIVYVTLQKTAENVADHLAQHNFPARAYHAGMEGDIRHEVQEWWMREPAGIVVATIAFGMGIDKANVRYVYHYNLPKSLESYSQEIGRAGRDDLPSTVELLACRDDIPVLENFAYGDTPTPQSLTSLVREVLGWRDAAAISPYDLSQQHDMRMLVLRTALTYLELMGVIRAGTPFYAGYEIKPITPIPMIAKAFPGEHGEFARSLFNFAKRGRIWYGLNPDDAARALGVERRRVVRALEVMEERAMIELKAGDVRTPYTLRPGPHDADAIAEELVTRFQRREDQEIARLNQVVELVEHDGCQVNSLVAYFGQNRAKPCGHCTWCLTKQRQRIPSSTAPPIHIEEGEVVALYKRCPRELQSPRQIAKILCGLTSPVFSRLRMNREGLFGVLEAHRFAEVVAWCEAVLVPSQSPLP
ncbi:MAG TPA: RecQ family ATP-dependent DNA helicase [Fimbriimonadaceae bacterium]|nr:RecQ family ATP-dependent DNA helicase [Fimbriimonadaceae bacterium]